MSLLSLNNFKFWVKIPSLQKGLNISRFVLKCARRTKINYALTQKYFLKVFKKKITKNIKIFSTEKITEKGCKDIEKILIYFFHKPGFVENVDIFVIFKNLVLSIL